MQPCPIGMEACVGAHHLGRKLKALVHDARLTRRSCGCPPELTALLTNPSSYKPKGTVLRLLVLSKFQEPHMHHYARLTGMTALSFISMYILMYSMVDRFGNVFNSVNQVYMAGLMAAPMVVIELLLMGSMYEKKKANIIIMAVSIVAAIVFFIFIRMQTAVTDRQFIRSMVPHHSGAVLMCERATLSDAELLTLCEEIIKSQQREIDQMKGILDRLNAR